DFYTNFTRKMFLTTAGVLTMAGGASCDGTTWNNASDRNLKTAFASISPAQVLQNLLSLPVQSWQYKSDSAGSRHIGPVAQDFHRGNTRATLPEAATLDLWRRISMQHSP